MSKRRLKIHFRIPEYNAPRNQWRRRIHADARRAVGRERIQYSEQDKLQISVILYFNTTGIGFHDVDNRAKDVLDALQGRMGGPKSKEPDKPIIPNDSQVFKLVVMKKLPPKQSRGAGHVTISKFKQE